MIYLGKSGFTSFDSGIRLDVLRAQFAQHHYIRFPQLIEQGLLEFIQSQIDRGEFYERVHQDIGSNKELCMKGNAAFGALLFLTNDKQLFQIIQDVTQCDQIGCFEGRVYRVNPYQGHHDSWHNDIGEDRLVGMSINLSKDKYAGGLLQIRDHASREILSEAENAGIGDAIVFRLAPHLQHRITEVQGKVPKTAFAGWFRAQPDFPSLLKHSYSPRQTRRINEMRIPARSGIRDADRL
jgi:hypothetical protein